MSVGVLVDSSSNLSLDQADELGVHLLMQAVQFAGRNWLDDHTELSSEVMFRKLREGASFPTTRSIGVQGYQQTIEYLLHKHSHVYALHYSSQYGETIQVAREAVKDFPNRMTIYESQSLTGAIVFQADRAVRLLRSGVPPAEVTTVLEASYPRIYSRLCLGTTEYVRRSGRLNNLVVRFGSLINVQPVIGLNGPSPVVYALPLSSPAALQVMRRHLLDSHLPSARILFLDNGASQEVEVLRQEALRLGFAEFMSLTFSVAVSAVLGPGTFAYALEPLQLWHNFRSYN